MTLTRARTIQYIGILSSLLLIAVGYWYWSARAGVKTNTSALQPQGVGDLSSGLAGYWRLDETTGSSAADASTNGNNGTLNNMENGDWVTGQIDNGLSFDGTNESITVAAGTGIIDAKQNVTLSAWVYPRSVGSYMGFIYKGASGCDEATAKYMLEINVSGFITLWMGGSQLVSSSTIVTNQWQHLVATNSASGSAIYLNGTRVASGAALTTPTSSSEDWRINYCNSFDGNMDEVRIYDRTLSADEVASLYRLTSPTGVDTSLKGYWSFNTEAIAGTTAYDWSGAGNTGTLTNGPGVAEGRIGRALGFFPNGTDPNAYVTMGDPSTGALDFGSGDFAVGFWMKGRGYTSQGSSYNVALCKKSIENQENAGYCFLYGSDNKMSFELGNGTTGIRISESVATAGNNDWNYYFAARSGSGVSLSVNGQVVVTSTLSGSVSSSSPYTIGSDTSPDRNANAIIDEVRAYNRALTSAEIKSLYDRGAPDRANTSAGQRQGAGNLDSGLTAYWRLDETTGSTASDSSTNANNATLSNMENGDWVTGQIGNGLDFDGSNEYVSASASPIASHSSGTITAWIKSTNGSAAQTIFGFSTTASSDYAGFLGTNSVGKLQFRIKGNGSDLINCGVTDSGSSAQVAASGTWTFVAITNDGTGKKMYKNGSLQGTDCGSDTTWLSALSAQPPVDASIGAWLVAGAPQSLFQGSIDEVRVYNRAFSSEEIGQLYRLTTPTAVDTGLKGYWSFNGSDLSGTTAFDRSGAGNTGTLTNGPEITEGVSGQALSFDGSDDYLPMSSNSVLDFTNNDFTLTGWFYRDTENTADVILAKRNNTGVGETGYMVDITTSDAMVFRISDGTDEYRLTSSTLFNTPGWHHFAIVWDDDSVSGTDLYINGRSDSPGRSGTLGAIDTVSFTNIFRFGMASNGSDPFDGRLDEMRVYTRTLSSSEIKAQYDAANPDKTNTSVSTPQGTGRLDSGLRGYWKLDENTGTSASDSSTNAVTALAFNGGPAWAAGQIGAAVDFDGTDDYLSTADTSILDFTDTDDFTISGWFNRDTFIADHTIVSKRGGVGAGYAGYLVYIDSTDDLNFHISDGSDTYRLDTAATFTSTGWNHFVVVWDQDSAANSEIYINGVASNATDTGIIGNIGDLSNSLTFRLGADSSSDDFFDGKIDDVRIYDRALSLDEIAQLYRLNSPTGTDTGLKGYWSFNGQDMNNTIAVDRSGAGNNGTLTNGPAITEGKLGQALSFDGSDDHVSVPDSPSLSSTTAFSVSFWALRTGVVNSGRNYIRKTDTGDRSWVIGTGDFGVISFTIASDVNDSGSNYVTTPNGVVVSGQWVHVTAVFDGSGSTSADRAKIYANGALQPVTVTGTIATSAVNNSAALNIGGLGGGGDLFPGKIDEVRYYSRALSANEIKALYDSGR